MTGPEYTGTLEDIDGNTYKIFMDVYTPMMPTPQSPKLVFKRVQSYQHPPAVSFSMHWFGLPSQREQLNIITEWCAENSCGYLDMLQEQIIFDTEEEMVWFLLRWA
jgi:hypothetical protein